MSINPLLKELDDTKVMIMAEYTAKGSKAFLLQYINFDLELKIRKIIIRLKKYHSQNDINFMKRFVDLIGSTAFHDFMAYQGITDAEVEACTANMDGFTIDNTSNIVSSELAEASRRFLEQADQNQVVMGRC